MSALLHHLAVLGWGWVALFVALDTVAVAAAVLAVVGRKPRRAVWALLLCVCAALVSVGATTAVATAGLSFADTGESTGAAPSERARDMAQGLSVAMNGTALGLVATFVVALAAVVCLLAAVVHRSRAVSQSPRGL
jgi:phosphatidylglycerophosphate synthase